MRVFVLLVFYSKFVLPRTVFEIFDFKYAVTLKTGLGLQIIEDVTNH